MALLNTTQTIKENKYAKAARLAVIASCLLLLVSSCKKESYPSVPGEIAINQDSIQPQNTDNSITTTTAGSTLQYTYWPKDASVRKDVLFIMIPGTFGTPESYRYVLKYAAKNGYYAFGLAYDNLYPIEILAGFTPSDNTVANILEEFLTGTNASDKVAISRSNSFENRIIKMILFMDAKYPADNWKRFLNADNTLQWNKLSVSGHSQGSDHCMYMSKKRSLYRAAFIGGPGSFKLLNGQYPGFMQQAGATSMERLYGFNHTEDPTRKWSDVMPTWSVLGIPGAPVSVDGSNSFSSHQLITSRQDSNGHLSVVIDQNTALDNQGNPVYLPVWQYMSYP